MKPAHIALLILAAWCGGQLYGSKLATSAAKLRAAEQLQTASEEARQAERALNKKLLTQSEQLIKEKAANEEARQRINADIYAGRVRLSTRTTSGCSTATATGESGATARADLLPEDGAALIGLALDADDVVRQLGAVQAAYDAARVACIGGHQE